MAELFLAMSGRLSNQIIGFYLSHQLVLNLLVVAYGVILAIAHQNLRKIEHTLIERYGTRNWPELLPHLADEDPQTVAEFTRSAVRIPVVASPYFFALYRINRRNLIQVLGKKHAIQRSQLYELMAVISTEARVSRTKGASE